MNFYFGAGLGAHAYAVNAVKNVVGWPFTPSPASDQWMHNDGVCEKQATQLASATASSSKYHTRMKQGRRVDPQFTLITASPMHHDVLASGGNCGPINDVADSFNSARDYAAQKIQAVAGYFAVYSFTGNTARITQCDGRVTWSDGSYVLART